MGKYENNICQAVNILINQAVSGLRLDKTILGTIESCVDEGLKEYRVKYQDSSFTAYSQTDTKYRKGTSVYVLIPSNDITQDRIILGTVSKLGEAYISAATAEDKMTKIGTNIFTKNNTLSLCSYKESDAKGYDTTDLYNMFGIDTDDINIYKNGTKYLMIAATFQTNLTQEQQLGNGDYGLVVTCRYYNNDTKNEYLRKYTINVASMIGQPYKFILPNRQYGLFQIDGDNLLNIESLDVYSRGFPIQAVDKADDIFISNFEFYFMEELSLDEIAGTSLKILTPEGSYFKPEDTLKVLLAEIKIKGSAIQNTNTSNIEYYWFVRDAFVTTESEFYSSYAGVGWKCLNKQLKDSSALGGDDQTNVFVPGIYQKTIYPSDCPSKENLFKCVAVLEDTVLYSTITIYNQSAAYNISIAASEPNSFPFETAYNFHLTPTITTSSGTDISDSVKYYWGFSADNGNFERLNDNNRILYHDPNIAINLITYNVTIYNADNTILLGNAEITFININNQKMYNLIIANANQVFKYNEEGISPASNSIEKQNRQVVLPLTFELYDKQSRIVAEKDNEKIKLFESRWLWPVNNTMILADHTGLNTVDYNGILCWERKIYNDTQLTFSFEIMNKYNINNVQNNIILEVKYQDLISVATTNFTFTKEGELGTNGTKYTARIQPQDALDIEKVYVHNNLIRYWKYENGVIKNYTHTGRFNLEIWDGGTNYIKNTNTAHWEILPVQSRTSTSDYTNYNISLANNSIGRITSRNKNFEQATILQGYINTNEYSNLAKDYYASYSLPVVKTSNSNQTYIVQGGYDHVIYSADGNRSSFDDILPFTLKSFNISTQEEITLDAANIQWYVSWTGQTYVGITSLSVEPPEKLTNEINNYIKIINGDDMIILSVNLYINKYSMTALNGWDGVGIEVNEDKGYILTPQLAAGSKNHNNNTFTGIAIGQTFSKENKNNNEVGLFGYLDSVQTIKLDAKTGSATFGIDDNAHGCLKIIPSSTSDAITIRSGNFQEAEYEGYDSDKKIKTPGTGVEMEFSSSNPHITFGKGTFTVDKNGNVYLAGIVQATKGYIGGWKIQDTKLIGTTSNGVNKIQIDANGSEGPQISAYTNNTRTWYIKGDGSFKFGTDNTYVKFDNSNSKLQVRADLIGTGWYIYEGGNFSLGNGGITYSNGNLRINAGTINLNAVNATYNGCPIQGRNVSQQSGSGDGFSLEVRGVEFPTFVILNLRLNRGDSDLTSGSTTIWGIPKCNIDGYTVVATSNANEDCVLVHLQDYTFYFDGLKKSKTYYGTIVYRK